MEVVRAEVIRAFSVDFSWGLVGPNGFAKPGLWVAADPGGFPIC